MASITRAFTTRRVKHSVEAAKEAREAALLRQKISAPMQLISTTNMLSYNAPDIVPQTATSSSSSTKSDDDSDSATTVASSPPTSPDVAPGEACCPSPEPNHLSSYFMAPGEPLTSRSAATEAAAAAPMNPPAIPKRAPSHTKKASYEALARQRSMSQMSRNSDRTVSTKASLTFSRSSSSSTSTSVTSHNSLSAKASMPALGTNYQKHDASEPLHPFGQELAKVSELAEEFGGKEKLHVIDEEERELLAKGLRKFSADDYISEINSLIASFFPEPRHAPPVTAAWI